MSLKLEYATSVNATPDVIWSVFQQIEDWPRWDPSALQSARWISGEPWTTGATFELRLTKPMPLTLTPTLVEVDPPVFVHIKGSSSGVTAEQFFIFKWDPATNTTEMRTLQEFSGMPITLFGAKAKRPLEEGIAHMFSRVRQEAEERAHSAGGSPSVV